MTIPSLDGATMGPIRSEQDLLDKIRSLPPEKAAEVEDFVDFLMLRQDDRRLAASVTKQSEASFFRVWDNDDDAAYDEL